MSEPLPRLRGVELFAVPMGEEIVVACRDPLGYVEQTLVLSPAACFIAAHLDGKNGVAEVQASFERQFAKRQLPTEAIEQVVKMLDEHFLLDNDRFRQKAREVQEAFRAAPSRLPAHSEGVYADEPEALRKQLGGYFAHAQGPGKEPAEGKGELAAVVSPHIDFHRGGPAYAWAYREVLARPMADLYVVLGVAHMSPPSPFVLTPKDFATPLGAAKTDADLVRALAGDLDWDPFEFEITHRKEHSVEFQAVFLRYCADARGEDFKMLPVLCAGDTDDARTTAFLSALAGRLRRYPGRVCLVAGVDLSHMGRRFGDDFDINPDVLGRMEKGDRAGIERVLSKDAKGWLDTTAPRGNNERKVCGLGALYAFTWLLKELSPDSAGTLLRYGHAPDPAGGEVSFASLVFTR